MRLRLLLVVFGQWRQRVLGRRADRIDKRTEWWSRWTQRLLP